MTITKVLIPLENIRLFYRIQRNIDRSFKYNTRKDGACGSFFIELMEETKKKKKKHQNCFTRQNARQCCWFG